MQLVWSAIDIVVSQITIFINKKIRTDMYNSAADKASLVLRFLQMEKAKTDICN